MSEDRFTENKRAAATPDVSQYSPGFGPLLLIVVCGVILIAIIGLSLTTGIGPLFAIPIGLVALGVAFVMLRGRRPRPVASSCPHCGRGVDFPPHMAEFNCPACGQRIESPGGGDLRHAA